MLVACQLVNLTTWRVARPAFEHLLGVYRDAEHLRHATETELHWPLRPLGMWRRRAKIIPAFSSAWLRAPPVTAQDVKGLPGCGKYASDSWAIFIDGRTDVEPTDGKLIWYLRRKKEIA